MWESKTGKLEAGIEISSNFKGGCWEVSEVLGWFWVCFCLAPRHPRTEEEKGFTQFVY